MKKLMIAAFAIAFAAVANAASVNWQSGITPELPGYEFGNEAITMIVFENSVAYDIGSIWNDYQAGTIAGTKVGTAVDDMDAWINDYIEIAGGSDWADGSSVYAAVIFTHEGANGIDYYIVNAATAEATDAGNIISELGNMLGGLDGEGTALTWTEAAAVPEPTSALMLLVGLAGLALKRKVA